LAAAHAKVKQSVPDIRLHAAQVALTYLELDPGPVDGERGRRTRGALIDFQGKHKLPETGELDEATEEKLNAEAFG
jgi:peptidoglycan hydrolase-like protein with peptidoglycan-binding domain